MALSSRSSRLHVTVPAAPVVGAPLDQARAAFAWLTHRPGPLTIDGRAVRGLPTRPVPVDELRDRLLHPSCTPAVRDAIWAHLIRRARSHGGAATVVCVGVALPALTEISRRLSHSLHTRTTTTRTEKGGRSATRRRWTELAADVESGVLSGFLTELAITDLRSPGVEVRLRSAAHEAGRLVCVERVTAPPLRRAPFRSRPPLAPAQHPDLVLARAVAAGAITRSEAILIGSTRLEPISLATIARARGHALRDVRAARVRAERKLAAFLRGIDPEPTGLPHPTAASPRERGADERGADERRADEGADGAGFGSPRRGATVSEQRTQRRHEANRASSTSRSAAAAATAAEPVGSRDGRRRRVRVRRSTPRHAAPPRGHTHVADAPRTPTPHPPAEPPSRSTAGHHGDPAAPAQPGPGESS